MKKEEAEKLERKKREDEEAALRPSSPSLVEGENEEEVEDKGVEGHPSDDGMYKWLHI